MIERRKEKMSGNKIYALIIGVLLTLAISGGWIIHNVSLLSNGIFEIYLVDTGEIVVTEEDILFYRKSSHQIKLTDEGSRKIEELSLMTPLNGTKFAIRLYGEDIYSGWFWTPISSISCSDIVIETLVRNNTIKIATGYPSSHFQGEDPRDNPKILNYFQEVGKLIDDRMQITVKLSSDIIIQGENVIISAIVRDQKGNTIEGATVTATLGDLEILFLLLEEGNGTYKATIDTSIVKEGIYDIIVTAQKEKYEPDQVSLTLNVIASTSYSVIVEFMKRTDIPEGLWDETIEIVETYAHKPGGKIVVVRYTTATGGHPDFFLDAHESHTAVIIIDTKGEVASAFCVDGIFHDDKIWDLFNQIWITY
jgi:hypothetical protein